MDEAPAQASTSPVSDEEAKRLREQAQDAAYGEWVYAKACATSDRFAREYGMELADAAAPWAKALLSWYRQSARTGGTAKAGVEDAAEVYLVEFIQDIMAGFGVPPAEVDMWRLVLRLGNFLRDPAAPRWNRPIGTGHARRYTEVRQLDQSDPALAEEIHRHVRNVIGEADRVQTWHPQDPNAVQDVMTHRVKLVHKSPITDSYPVMHSSLGDLRAWLPLDVPGPIAVLDPLWYPHLPDAVAQPRFNVQLDPPQHRSPPTP